MPETAELFGTVRDELEASARVFRDELDTAHPFVRELCEHIEHFRGKQIRPALVLLTGQACGGLQPAHRILAAVVEMVHIATLVHDDVLDEAEMRRRAPTVSRQWGNESAVLLGDLLFSHAFRLCSTLDDQFAALQIGQTSVQLCAGELMQVGNQDNLELSEAEYFQIIEGKTASLIGTCCLLGARYAGADEAQVAALNECGLALGTAFQITDDLLDLMGDEAEVGKTLGRDVEKCKLTLPLIRYLETADAKRRAQMVELLRGNGDVAVGAVATLLAESESIDYARQVAAERIERATQILEELPPSEARASLLAMAGFVIARRK